MQEVMVSVDHVKKVFKVPGERFTSLKQHAVNIFKPKDHWMFKAIEDVSFEIYKGEFFGIIGQNGSGKSTLLKILASIYSPTSGSIKINGRLSPFIELGVGFNPELTARENVYLNGAILGLGRKEIDERFEDIIGFAELEEFVDQKLKNFSSGMLVRLAFSVAIQAHAEILLIDEVLAVGDSNFQQKCFDVFRRMKAEGKTIIFVSHDLASIKEFSDRVLVLNKAKAHGIFSAEKAIAVYSELNQEKATKELSKAGKVSLTGVDRTKPHIQSVQMLGADNKPTRALEQGEKVRIVLSIKNPHKEALAAGVAVYRNSDGFYCFGTNTDVDKITLPQTSNIELSLSYTSMELQAGVYSLVIGLFDDQRTKVYQMQEHVLDFQVSQKTGYEGLVVLDHEWTIAKKK